MRTAGLSFFVALSALHTVTVNGDVVCNNKTPMHATPATSLPGLQNYLSTMVSALCRTSSGKYDTVSDHLEHLVLEVHRGKSGQDVDECQMAFAAIISRCIGTGKASGGEIHADKGNTYRVCSSSPDDHRSNQARDPSTAKPGLPQPAPAKPAPAKPAPAKPAPAKPNPAKPNPAKPNPAKPAPAKPAPAKPAPAKPPPTPVKPSPSLVPAKTVKIGPTKDCKQLVMLMQKPTGKEKLPRNIEEDRGGYVGSRVDIKSGAELAKRAARDDDEWDGPGATDTRTNHEGTPKKGTACGLTFDALRYPKAESMPVAAPYFSIDSQDDFCETIKFQETKTAVLGLSKYHIEHILEWQTVAKFFDWMDRKSEAASKKFKNPDPTKISKQLTFCQYLAEQWKGSYAQKLTINGKTMLPFEHMAQAFPGVKNREDEFVWLQATINTPAKSNMWAYKGSKDDAGTLHNPEKMREFITGERTVVKGQNLEKVSADLVDNAKIALLKLKALMGARKYMRSKTVSDIFKRQKEEIGKMLIAIDEELPKNPRKPLRGQKTIDPWVEQDLGKFWTEYMDERFAIAHKRTHNDMDTYLKLLDDKWCEGRPKSKPGSPAGSRPGTPTSDPIETIAELFGALDLNDVKRKDLCRFLDKVQKEWTAEKAIRWTKPW